MGTPFPGDEPGEAEARPTRGDYIARMHSRIKKYIREEKPAYQYPRTASFRALVHNLAKLGLVERTGEREEGFMEVAQGWSPRTYYRLTPGAEARAEWQDPIGFLGLQVWPNVLQMRHAPAPLRVAAPLAPAPPAKWRPRASSPRTPSGKGRRPGGGPGGLAVFTIAERPGRAAAQALVQHLQALEGLAPGDPHLQEELTRLQEGLQVWEEAVQEALDREEEREEPDEDRLEGLRAMMEGLDRAGEALGQEEIGEAVEAVEEAVPQGAPRIAPPRAPRGPVAPEGGPQPPPREELEGQRTALVAAAAEMERTGQSAGEFQDLLDRAMAFDELVRPLYRVHPFPGLREALALLGGCVPTLQGERLPARQATRRAACQRAAGFLAQEISTPLGPPERVAPRATPVPTLRLEAAATRRGVERVRDHLQVLQDLGIRTRGVGEEVERVATGLEAWDQVATTEVAVELAKPRPRLKRVDQLQQVAAALGAAARDLRRPDIRLALQQLEGAYSE